MKVTIGPYPENDEERLIDIHIDKYDTWSMDHTLSLIIVPMLKQLKETTHGAPNVADEDVPEELRSTSAPPKKNEWDIDDNHFKRWDWVLDEMIWAFEQSVDSSSEDQFYSGKSDPMFQALDKDNNPIGKPYRLLEDSEPLDGDIHVYQMIRGPEDTFKVDSEGLRLWYERRSNGYRLFGKYYLNLWD